MCATINLYSYDIAAKNNRNRSPTRWRAAPIKKRNAEFNLSQKERWPAATGLLVVTRRQNPCAIAAR